MNIETATERLKIIEITSVFWTVLFCSFHLSNWWCDGCMLNLHQLSITCFKYIGCNMEFHIIFAHEEQTDDTHALCTQCAMKCYSEPFRNLWENFLGVPHLFSMVHASKILQRLTKLAHCIIMCKSTGESRLAECTRHNNECRWKFDEALLLLALLLIMEFWVFDIAVWVQVFRKKPTKFIAHTLDEQIHLFYVSHKQAKLSSKHQT